MLSILAIDGLLSVSTPVSTQLLAQQWAGMYHRGKVLGPQVAILGAFGYGYLAYERSSRGLDWTKFVGAAALTLGMVPFTFIFMFPTNNALLRVAAGVGAMGGEGAVRELLVKWKDLNLMRSLFPLAGAALGFWGLVA